MSGVRAPKEPQIWSLAGVIPILIPTLQSQTFQRDILQVSLVLISQQLS